MGQLGFFFLAMVRKPVYKKNLKFMQVGLNLKIDLVLLGDNIE